jgi:hypothetical protein
MATKHLKNGEGESRRGDDEARDELPLGVAIAITQGEEGRPNKKASAPSKTISQLREELNLDPIPTELNVEQGVVDQAFMVEDQPNIPLEGREEVESEESEKDSDREEPRRRETPIAKLRDELREMKATIIALAQQNQMLVEMVQKRRSLSSDGSKPTYMKNVPKPTAWDTKDKMNIETFLTEYEMYCDALGYIGDDVRLRIFRSFLKDGASIVFAAWRGSRVEALPWKNLKE